MFDLIKSGMEVDNGRVEVDNGRENGF